MAHWGNKIISKVERHSLGNSFAIHPNFEEYPYVYILFPGIQHSSQIVTGVYFVLNHKD
jgi:hypothetical protein